MPLVIPSSLSSWPVKDKWLFRSARSVLHHYSTSYAIATLPGPHHQGHVHVTKDSIALYLCLTVTPTFAVSPSI